MKKDESQSPQNRVRSKAPVKLLSVAVSAVILFLLYRRLDREALVEVLSSADVTWLVLSVGMIIPITFLNALRFRWVVSSRKALGAGDAIALTLVALALNLFLPAKLGDLAKSHYLYRKHQTPGGVSISIIVFERLCDMFAVAVWCLFGWLSGWAAVNIDAVALPALALWLLSGVLLFSGGAAGALFEKARGLPVLRSSDKLQKLVKGWPDVLAALGPRSKWLILFSVGTWFLHLTQYWMFTVAIGAEVPFPACLALSAVVVLCGLVPFTLAGIGPRDVALVYLFAPFMAAELAAAIGVLAISRSVVPALLGLPFMRRYLGAVLAESSAPNDR